MKALKLISKLKEMKGGQKYLKFKKMRLTFIIATANFIYLIINFQLDFMFEV